MKIKKIYFVKTIKDAVSLIKKKNSIFIAGSSYSFKNMASEAEIAIMGSNLPLSYIRKDTKFLKIGALTTFSVIEQDKLCKDLFGGVLAKAASACSSQLVRNMATIGGNIAHLNAFNLMPLLCCCLNARVKIAEKGAIKTVSWKDIYCANKKAGRDFLIIEILFPLSHSENFFYFEKVSKIKSSWDSYITACFSLKVKNKIVKNASIVFSALTAMPLKVVVAEKELEGKKLSPDIIEKASLACEKAVEDIRHGSKIWQYRAKLAKNLSSYFLNKVMEAR